MIHPGVQIKPIEGNTLLTDGNFRQIGPYIGIEAVAVHAEILRSIPEPDQAGQQTRQFFAVAHSIVPRIVTTGLRPA